MVYTKHFNVRSIKHMNTAVGYVENATKTVKTVKENDHFDSLFPYIINGDKTIEQQLVSGYQISDVYHANEEFLWTKQVALLSKGTDLTLSEQDGQLKLDAHAFEKNNVTLAHHLIQSFSPDDNLSPEEIHEIGRKTVLELTGGIMNLSLPHTLIRNTFITISSLIQLTWLLAMLFDGREEQSDN